MTHHTRETHILTALLPQILITGFARNYRNPFVSKGIKWWAWQGLNLRPLRCQGRDTSAFPYISAVFRCSGARTRRERMGNCARVYRAVTAIGGGASV